MCAWIEDVYSTVNSQNKNFVLLADFTVLEAYMVQFWTFFFYLSWFAPLRAFISRISHPPLLPRASPVALEASFLIPLLTSHLAPES
jgi:hypothetical protein